MKYLILIILLSSCSFSDYDFNPSTTILKQLIKGQSNRKKVSALAYVGHNANGDREKDDFYQHQKIATQSLLDKQKFRR